MSAQWLFVCVLVTFHLCYISATKYESTFKTSSDFLAGTNAKVSVKLRGGGRESPKKTFPENQDGFERGGEYEADIVTSSLDSVFIDGAEVSHDDAGWFSDWKLQHLYVVDTRRQISYKFNYNEWVEKSCHWVRCGWWWCQRCSPAKRDLTNPDVDGRWSDWSNWHNCVQNGRLRRCRRRYCNNPPRSNNGKDCQGPNVQY